MPFDGNGNWTSNFSAVADRDANIKILASRFDGILLADIAQSFENCLTKDMQVKPQQAFNANNHRVINVSDPIDVTDAVNKQTLDGKDALCVHKAGTETITGDKTFSGSVDLGSSATVTTPSSSDNSTKVANTAWVKSNMTGIPDYANRTEFTTAQYTPTAHGVIVVKATGSSPVAEISTNDDFVIVRSKSTDSSSGTQVVWAIVKSGNKYKTAGSGTIQRWFIPFA